MFKKLIVFGTVFLLPVFTAVIGLDATSSSANHSWSTYHWARTSNPFTLKLGDNVTSTWDGHLSTASTDWTASAVLDTTVVAGSAGNVKRCTPPNGRAEVCNSKYGFNGWLGIAGIYVSGGHIYKGYVKLNDSYFQTATYNKSEWRQYVMCQEIGHIFGLGHTDEDFYNEDTDTCMDYDDEPTNNQHPNAHDYEQLETIYAHLDSTTTVGADAPTGPGRSGNAGVALAPGLDEHGLPPHASPANGDVYVTDLGNGEKLIVHVFWIPRGLPGARPD